MPQCAHFSYWKATRTCHLQDHFALRQEKQGGFVSGPFQCWTYLMPNLYSDGGNYTYLPHKFRCMQPGVTWEPDMDTPTVIMGARDDVVLKCQDKCHKTFGCKHFTVIFPNTCKFAGSGAHPTKSTIVAMSGPDVPRCDHPGDVFEKSHTFMRKFSDQTGQGASVDTEEPRLVAAVRYWLPLGAAVAVAAVAVAFGVARSQRQGPRRLRVGHLHLLLQDEEVEDGLVE